MLLWLPRPEGQSAQEGVQVGVGVLALHAPQQRAHRADGASGAREDRRHARFEASLAVQVGGLQEALALHAANIIARKKKFTIYGWKLRVTKY